MKGFLIKMVFRVDFEEGSVPQFDVQTRFITAHSMEDAFLKACALGKSQDESLKDRNGRKLSWTFVGVTDLLPMENFSDGDQVFSSTHHTGDVNGFVEYIRARSMSIQSESLICIS